MDKKPAIIPYLTFNGKCQEAVSAYMTAFGGEVLYMSRWDRENCENPGQIGKVMHAEFVLGSTRMGAGDNFDLAGENTGVRLMVHMDSMEEARQAIETLAQGGGTVLSPLRPHPAPDDGGCGSMTRDRFGYSWIITCPNPEKP